LQLRQDKITKESESQIKEKQGFLMETMEKQRALENELKLATAYA
jgi:hypothetical protein